MEVNKSPIAVIGAGSWGMALALVLAKNEQKVYVWDRNSTLLEQMLATGQNRYLSGISLPSNIVIYQALSETITKAQDILIAVPSHAFAEALLQIKPFLRPSHRMVWATKGLEQETGNFLHQVVERELGSHYPYAVLSGPSFAREVALGLPTAVNIASKNIEFAEELAIRFSHDTFKVYTTDDVIGVQLGGVVKNVLAVAVGVSDGVQFGANARAALITQGLAEMMRLGEAVGARPETLMGLAGCGDVILSCTDNQSRNRRFGLALAAGLTEKESLQRIGQVVEAVYNIEQLCNLAKLYQLRLPIAEQVFRIMKHQISPREAVGALFKRVPEGDSLAN